MRRSGSCQIEMSGPGYRDRHDAGAPDHEPTRAGPGRVDARIRERRATQAEVAEHLDLSVRQVERLVRAYKAGGAAALVSKKRGRPSGRRLPTALRQQTVDLVRDRYADFGPTLAHEKLVEAHGVKVSVETLRPVVSSAQLRTDTEYPW